MKMKETTGARVCTSCGKAVRETENVSRDGKCNACYCRERRRKARLPAPGIKDGMDTWKNGARKAVFALTPLKFLARDLGVSKQAVNQTEMKALYKLRALLAEYLDGGEMGREARAHYIGSDAARRARADAERDRRDWGSYVDPETAEWYRDKLVVIQHFRDGGLHEEANELKAELDKFREERRRMLATHVGHD